MPRLQTWKPWRAFRLARNCMRDFHVYPRLPSEWDRTMRIWRCMGGRQSMESPWPREGVTLVLPEHSRRTVKCLSVLRFSATMVAPESLHNSYVFIRPVPNTSRDTPRILVRSMRAATNMDTGRSTTLTSTGLALCTSMTKDSPPAALKLELM